jgi:ABC-type oligopeptide transport system substrate-binding subunit
MEVEPFTNKLVRQALMYAVDREALLALVYEGNATPSLRCNASNE